MSVRRLPVYILLDTSGSMRGEPIQAVENGLRVLISSLRQDPQALESVHISLITFDLEARELLPLTPLDQIQAPPLEIPGSGPTLLGAALWLLIDKADREIRKTAGENKGDWRPLAFIMTDGSPSDLADFRAAIPEVQKRNFANVVACAAGPKAKPDFLRELTATVMEMDVMDSASFSKFFKWVSACVASCGTSSVMTDNVLPPPPEAVTLTL